MLRSVSSCTEMTEASDEFFSALTASLPKRRNHGADRLRRDDAPHQHGRRHAQRLPGQDLSPIDAQHAGAQDLRDERRLVGGQRQAGRADRAELDADLRQGVVGEHHLQDQRRAAKDDGVGAGERRQQPEAAELHAGEHQPEHQPAGQPEGGHHER